MRLAHRALFSAACALVTFAATADAHANHLEACGGVYMEVSAAASCEVLPTETCTTRCEPVAGEIVCAARLTTQCEQSCTATAEVECVSTCTETCTPVCTEQESQGQPPNCMGLCMSDCQQDCNAACADAPNQGECRSSCAHCCSSDCHAQCNAAPEPVCEPVCETACTGSCEGRANIDCQVSCQSGLYASCKTQVVEECKQECTVTGAAIFCSGQFLATGGDLQGCADEIEAEFGVTLDVSVSVQCEGGSCTAEADAAGEGNASLDCSAASDASGRGPWGMALVAMAGLGIAARRRTRRA